MHRSSSPRFGATASDHLQDPASVALACMAVALPALVAFSPPPSPSFLNQATALVGWGSWLLYLSAHGTAPIRPWRGGLAALLAALTLLALSAAVGPLRTGLPWTMALSAIGTLAAAGLVALAGASIANDGRAPAIFHALCVALLLAGLLNALIGVMQVYMPQWTGGFWTARVPGDRAAGNLRQPNHLSSLLLWSMVALSWLMDRQRIGRFVTAGVGLLLLVGIVLSGSRTGMLGVLLLGTWGLVDTRLSRPSRLLLLSTPLVFALLWLGLAAWAHQTHHVFAGNEQLAKGDISSSRFALWSNTLALIAKRPWLGVGWGEFNSAWTLTPFQDRPVAFYDHAHNLVLQFVVELGYPLALLVLALLGLALWRAFRAGAESAQPAASLTLRAAFVLVLLMVVHSQLEYPLWYVHFLLPTAFVLGLCLGSDGSPAAAMPRGSSQWMFVASALLLLGGLVAVADYARVAVIFAPSADAAPLKERIAKGQRSWLFGHRADCAAVTTAEHVPDPRRAFDRVRHYRLDAQLMMAWARTLEKEGQTDPARYVAQRLKEFHNEASNAFFAPCAEPVRDGEPRPFQCLAPRIELSYEDLR